MHQPPLVGLALGGGVARGLTHIGVLKALLESGIPIDYVAGTSAGALVGAGYCAGLSLETIETLALHLRWWHLARLAWSREGIINFQKMEDWLIKTAGDLAFDQLERPFVVATTDLETGMAVDLREGRVAPAVHASCVVPGFVVPVRLDGRILGDGSLVNTIPVQPLRAMGADYIIGVDLFRHKIRRWMGPFGYGLAALEITFSRAGCGYCTADCLITPALAGKTYLSFSKARSLIALGKEATDEQIPMIKQALHLD